jgi:hypothetical protein
MFDGMISVSFVDEIYIFDRQNGDLIVQLKHQNFVYPILEAAANASRDYINALACCNYKHPPHHQATFEARGAEFVRSTRTSEEQAEYLHCR